MCFKVMKIYSFRNQIEKKTPSDNGLTIIGGKEVEPHSIPIQVLYEILISFKIFFP